MRKPLGFSFFRWVQVYGAINSCGQVEVKHEHGADVAERHYRRQVLERAKGASIEAAMGLG